ncbi:hypothetical protein [Streptomyces pseudovenezuelae]|uniref:Secreted protein n=1 Tax=Streptomyces pseudovenezuelae TaxID=67350 RepID=A0ABT6LFV9_9ACTN|nr:hypothetical protein [Streptomyces pseudovenezuelae]MDH6215191.1 hypothetical protein [Streptomyces pseudovenezuelae]
MSTARSLSRSRAWLRVLVLTLALLVPGETCAAEPVPATASVEYDAVEAALPPLVRTANRRAVPLRPVPLPAPAPAAPRIPAGAVLPRTPDTLRTVILRC